MFTVSAWQRTLQAGVGTLLSSAYLATNAENFWFWYTMMVSVVLGCVTASKTGITFLLFETENVTVRGQGHCCFPVFLLVSCCWFSCLRCSWTGRIVNSAEKGWWVRPMIKCRKTSCVCTVIWAPELEVILPLVPLVWGDLCYESAPGPLFRLIFQGMLACWETLHLLPILMFFCSAFWLRIIPFPVSQNYSWNQGTGSKLIWYPRNRLHW